MVAHGYMDEDLAAEVIAWYEASETDFVVMRAYIECVTNSHVERSSHRI